MKKTVKNNGNFRTAFCIFYLLLLTVLHSCKQDIFVGDEPNISNRNNSFPTVGSSTGASDKFLFCSYQSSGTKFYTKNIGSSIGNQLSTGYDNINWWNHIAGVQVGARQFVFFHNAYKVFVNYIGEQKAYAIRAINTNGTIGAETENSYWNNSYETIIGFHVGDRGFIFGQDSYSDHYWFVQEITGNGRLGAETDNGSWHNYYKSATPFYINGKTYIFFQTEDSDKYWFISYVSPDGKLHDVCDGRWGDFFDVFTSVEFGGKTFLIGEMMLGSGKGFWFIQQINPDGTLGPETQRGEWNNQYPNLAAWVTNGHAYLFGGPASPSGLNSMNYFIQEITAEGKLGVETQHGSLEDNLKFVFPFTLYEPGSFRYEIGWDLTRTTGIPSRGWSPSFSQPWRGDTKFGGGAALAEIDHDAGLRYDAVLTGIQSLAGSDRFYYQVAWNLNNTGEPASWSKVIYGPNCGEIQAGAGADIADIDRNGVPDLLLMSVDDPEKSNSFWYYIGWNLGTNGQASYWSTKIQLDGLGWDNSGGGAALGDIDKNGSQDLILTGIDNPAGANKFWYRIGRNLDNSGNASSWTSMLTAPVNLGDLSSGGGAALADLNGNGKPDLILTVIDSPTGYNPFWCYIGWDVDINGNVTGWSGKFIGPSLGNMSSGGGTAMADIDKNGILDILLMAVDNPYGKD